MKPEQLHVISVISNPVRYKSRPRLFKEFMERIHVTGVQHWIVEAVFGEREFEVTNPNNPHHIQVRCDHELWLKENMINIAAARLPRDWKYVQWMDGDIQYVRNDWPTEVLHGLQHYPVLQAWSHAVDMGPETETMQTATGFGLCYSQGKKIGEKYGNYWHPGYTWAWRRDAWDAVGGMIDLSICGSGDDHMAKGMIGEADRSMPKGLHPNYIHMVKAWESRATTFLKGNIGYIPATILHHFHGWKKDPPARGGQALGKEIASW